MSYDRWAFYFNRTAFGPAPGIEAVLPGVERETQLTLEQFMAAINSRANLSGIPRRRKWGA